MMTKNYEKYKDSGIEWIGDIPEYWEVRKLKFVFAFGKGLSITKDNLTESGIPVISYGQIHSKQNLGTGITDSLKRFVSVDYLHTNKQSLVRKNDFIFADTSEDLEGVGNCVFVDADDVLFAGYHTIILKAKNAQHNKYLAYLFLSDYWRTQTRSRVTGVKVFSITKTILNGNTILLPSITEQEHIARYLDWKTAEVDRIMSVRERQIKLLRELRTSIISQAVTRGLDPNAPLKDSGIEWIGQIPEHWDYNRMKFCVNKSFAGIWGNDAAGDVNDVRCYRVADFDYDKLSLSDNNPTDRNIDKNTFRQREVEYNDILIEKSGGGEITPVGRAVLVNMQNKAVCSNFVHCIKVRSNTHNKFLLYTLQSMYSKRINLLHFNQTTGIQNLNVAEYLGNSIFCPPLSEQHEISDYLDQKTAEIDATITKFRTQIEKLKEYRQSLISEVVTGKIDVRSVVIPTQNNC